MNPDLLILGASARSAAQSALRAGLSTACIDLFADADLAACSSVTRVESLGLPVFRGARNLLTAAWMYTGGIENRPLLVERLAQCRPLWGNDCEVLRQVRNPLRVAQALRAAGQPAAAVQTTSAGLPTDGTWLCKRRAASGGDHVFVWHGAAAEALNSGRSPLRGCYWQRRLIGRATSGLFVAARGRAQLLAVTEQLLDERPGAGGAFRYAGSIGPLSLATGESSRWIQIGHALADRFKLQGLFGVDAVVVDGQPVVVEVNPRYPASAEVWERATEHSAVGRHVAACRDGQIDVPVESARQIHGKAIVFADRRATVEPRLAHEWLEQARSQRWPNLADLPYAGTTLEPGQPILTVFASAGTVDDVREQLRWRREQVLAALWAGSDY